MEGLCSRRQAAHHDAAGHGVLAPLLPARAAKRLRENPLFWFSRESIPRALPPALPATAGERSPEALNILRDRLHLALPQLQRCDACHPQTYCCGPRAVRLLRYLLMLRTTADHRRARRTRAPSCACPSPNHLLAACCPSASSNFSVIATAFGDPTPTFRLLRALTSACGSSKMAFISHSQRPPQTPAASF
jgi:hypothetical protein